MPKTPTNDRDLLGDATGADKKVVEGEQAKLRGFVKSLSGDDIRSGGWFTQLIAQGLTTYAEKVNWQYFQEKYQGVPADAIVDQRIKLAARYAALEGGLSASAYTGAVVATLGTAGGASPLTLPAAGVTLLVDVAFITQLQLRLAYDIAVLYRVPLDVSDPEDLWKLIRVAFTIRAGEVAGEGALRAVPYIVRPLIKRYFSGAVLTAARGLPVVGKFLLQRNVIKIGIPGVGIPLAVGLNHWTTRIAGRHAQQVFRNEARVMELAELLSEQSSHPKVLLWVAWLVITVDKKISDDEASLMRHLVKSVRSRHEVADESLARLINMDAAEVWRRIDAEPGDLDDLVDAATRVAEVDGAINAAERAVLTEIRQHCNRPR